MSDGWAVSVKMDVLGGGESTRVFYARVSDPTEAEEVVKHHVNATPDVRVKVEKPMPASVFDFWGVAAGGVKQWL